jgi:uncharacterized protein DUF1643
MTDQASLVFDLPTQGNRRPVEPIVRAAQLERVGDVAYRWTAERAWGAGPMIVWCCLNPSYADGKKDDPTMWRMIGFSYRWGFGSMVVVNVYPFVASKTTELTRWRRTWRPKQHAIDGFPPWPISQSPFAAWLRNQDVVRDLLDRAHTRVAAWGNGIAGGEDLTTFLHGVAHCYDVERMLDVPLGVEWKCLGTTQGGAPTHPLARGKHRIPDDAQLIDWRRG